MQNLKLWTKTRKSDMKWRIWFVLMCLAFFAKHLFGAQMNSIAQSRDSCVQVIAADSRGTGFFISPDRVATCFHVVAALKVNGTDVQWTLHPDLKIKTSKGEVIDAVCVSDPNRFGPAPLHFDFAILKLKSKPKDAPVVLKLSDPAAKLDIGTDVIFSGYPLATPAMVTHKGMVSGIDQTGSIICIQAPINKGNSGGALLGPGGDVCGIIDMREGGISKGLQDLSHYIDDAKKRGSVAIMGVDPLAVFNEMIGTLDTYISTGIGYAVSTRHLRDYISAHPDVMN
jgi:S1-C subfamily serine protease